MQRKFLSASQEARFDAFYRAATQAHARLAMAERDALVRGGPAGLDAFQAKRRRQNAAYDARIARLEAEFFGRAA